MWDVVATFLQNNMADGGGSEWSRTLSQNLSLDTVHYGTLML